MISYKELFSKLDRAALIPFFVIGDPDYSTSLELVKAAIDNGADILELGIPFSDPIADGPTIQRADVRALDAGMTVEKSLKFIAEVKKYKDIPIGLLMYYNLVYKYGVDKFFKDFKAAGGNSVLIADMTVDVASEIEDSIKVSGLDTVYMVTPNTPESRREMVFERTTGFIYVVSLLGVTGARDTLSGSVKPLVQGLKASTDTPLCVGFGISKPEHAKQVAEAGANGVIVGSRIVKEIEENLGNEKVMINKVGALVAEFKKVLT